MDLHRLLRFQFIERLLIMIIGAFIFLNANAEQIYTENSETLIQGVTYDYLLFRDSEADRLDCSGTLTLNLSIPPKAERIIFSCTNRHANPAIPGHYFLEKTEYPISINQIVRNDYYWGTYFRITIWYSDTEYEITPEYFINDYIAQEDLGVLNESSSVQEIVQSTIVEPKGKDLFISPESPINLSICDMFGRQIFIDTIGENRIISLEEFSSQMLIVSYTDYNTVVTKKIIIP